MDEPPNDAEISNEATGESLNTGQGFILRCKAVVSLFSREYQHYCWIGVLGFWVWMLPPYNSSLAHENLPKLTSAPGYEQLMHWAAYDSPGEKLMQPEEIRSIVQKARLAWIERDANAFATLFANDGEFIVPGQSYRGVEAIRSSANDFFAKNSGVKIEIRRILIEGNQAVVEWRWQDTETATGKQSQADDAIVVDFQDGKIMRWREYIDTATPGRSSAQS